MKKSLFLVAAMLVSSNALAATDHYILRDGAHVQHLKISTVKGEVTVAEDVDLNLMRQKRVESLAAQMFLEK